MSHQFNQQQHWIDALAAKERTRRKLISEFQSAVPAFLDKIVSALGADVNEFKKQFKDEFITVVPNAEAGSIEITCASYLTPTRAIVQFHSESQEISCAYDGPISTRDWNERLEVAGLGLSRKGRAPDYGAADLSEKILKPVLFPAL